MSVDALLISLSPAVVYALVALVIGLESMGIPLPGEVILVSAALLSTRQDLDISLLRIFAGPLAGALRMPYPRFFAANALGGVVWAGGTTAAIYTLGTRAEEWLKESSWVGLGLALVAGIAVSTVFRRRLEQAVARHAARRESDIAGLPGPAALQEVPPIGPGGELVA